MWGALPLRSHWGFQWPNSRWALGSHDICFSNRSVVPIVFIDETVLNFDNYGTCRVLSAFFTLGQVLPTHRLGHSPYGGLFQPTMTQAIRLLSRGPCTPDPHVAASNQQKWSI